MDSHTLVYMPIYDSRSNDDRDENSGSQNTGCQQQIINNCVRDIHDCRNTSISDGPGYNHPVSHVFTPQEVTDLGGTGTRLPTTYYSYEKITERGTPVVNSHTAPTGNYIDQGAGEPYDCSTWGPTQVDSVPENECVSSSNIEANCIATTSNTTNSSSSTNSTNTTNSTDSSNSTNTTNNNNNSSTTNNTTGSTNNGTSATSANNVTTTASTNATTTSNSSTNDTTAPTPLAPITECQCQTRHRIPATCQSYNYTPITAHRQALSTTSTPTDKVPQYAITPISNTSDNNLARLKTYKFSNTDPNEDRSSFIIVDPSDFFDLRHYVAGGAHASGYNRFINGLVETYDTCPVLGLENGYSGICDPTGKSGCNLPIYGVGAQTNFTDAAGNSYSYNDYPIKWSGYVKKWAFITPEQYLDNVRDRKNVGGGRLYLDRNHINDNPILMITRADDYCELTERYSTQLTINVTSGTVAQPDMPCIQYLQYQSDWAGENYSFTDLFSPSEEPPLAPRVSYTIKHNYNIGADGKPDPNSPVLGTGSDIDIGGDGTRTGFVSFLDVTTPTSVYNDLSKGITGARALTNADYSGTNTTFDSHGKRLTGPVNTTEHELTAGEYLGTDPITGNVDVTKGVGIRLEKGTSVAVRMLHPVDVDFVATPVNPTMPLDPITNPLREVATTKCTDSMDSTTPDPAGTTTCSTCVIITLPPTESDIFIPTNSQEEFQSFVTAAGKNHNLVPSVTVRKCAGKYDTYNNAFATNTSVNTSIEGPNLNPNQSQTWIGKINCNSLTERPACNQTKMITAQRYCQLENGLFGNCNDCLAANDPDKATVKFTDEDVHGDIMINPYSGNASKCYFSAACFNNQANGCPSASSSAGHVFCLAADTKISMADGTEKDIMNIKAGEEVVAFEAKHSKSGILKKAKVKATAITKEQKIIKINDLRITPLHKVVLASGRAVMAKDINVGDKILKADGLIENVTNIESDLPAITVYNLVLEDGSDGYIANGLRVLSYPILKGLEHK